MNQNEQILEFNKIRDMLCEMAVSKEAKEKLMQLAPFNDERKCKEQLEETTRARHIYDTYGLPPVCMMKDLENIMELCRAGGMLLPEQLNEVAGFITGCRRMKQYLKRAKELEPGLASYGEGVYDLTELYEKITRAIRYDEVYENASSYLRTVCRNIELTQSRIQEKLNQMLGRNRQWFSGDTPVRRNHIYVLPVKKEYKNQVSGSVVDISGSKGTYFIEPASTARLREELSGLMIEKEDEIRRILYELTGAGEAKGNELRFNMEMMQKLDMIFAKAKLSAQMRGIPPVITTERGIRICGGRHPLIPEDKCVPVDFILGDAFHGVVITGPNTGGKTVALKTVGLLCMMAQCGLHVPAGEGTCLCMNSQYLCDIGDRQSISENLSTFSAHMNNVIQILDQVNEESLVLLDELGSGTDPTEGMGIAVAVLDELKKRGCLFLVTTHYPEVKTYAEKTGGIQNARMAFDRDTLSPLYRMEQGVAGESCALYIAGRLGMSPKLLKKAEQAAYGKELKQDKDTHIPLETWDQADKKQPVEKAGSKGPRIQPIQDKPVPENLPQNIFQMGDSVCIYPRKDTGIVYRPADEMGEVIVQVKGRKQKVLYKRLKLLVPASELYPEDYDFSIIFDTVANRKARHKMGKSHQPGLEIQYEDEL